MIYGGLKIFRSFRLFSTFMLTNNQYKSCCCLGAMQKAMFLFLIYTNNLFFALRLKWCFYQLLSSTIICNRIFKTLIKPLSDFMSVEKTTEGYLSQIKS